MIGIDMELPWSCMACRFRVYDTNEDRSRCVAAADEFRYAPFVELPSDSGRSSFCPIKETKELKICGSMIKKDFIVRRTITELEGKPHVETYSEEELVRCKDCCFFRRSKTIAQHSCILHESRCQENDFCSWAVKKKEPPNDYKEKVVELADEIGIHNLYAIVKEIRGE